MRKLVIIASIIILIGVSALVFFLALTGDSKTVSDEEIRQATYTGYTTYDFDHNDSALEIKEIKYLGERWVVAKIVLTGEPAESEAREMVYIYSKNEDTLELIAFSGDGFSRNSFPESMTYQDVTEILQTLNGAES